MELARLPFEDACTDSIPNEAFPTFVACPAEHPILVSAWNVQRQATN